MRRTTPRAITTSTAIKLAKAASAPFSLVGKTGSVLKKKLRQFMTKPVDAETVKDRAVNYLVNSVTPFQGNWEAYDITKDTNANSHINGFFAINGIMEILYDPSKDPADSFLEKIVKKITELNNKTFLVGDVLTIEGTGERERTRAIAILKKAKDMYLEKKNEYIKEIKTKLCVPGAVVAPASDGTVVAPVVNSSSSTGVSADGTAANTGAPGANPSSAVPGTTTAVEPPNEKSPKDLILGFQAEWRNDVVKYIEQQCLSSVASITDGGIKSVTTVIQNYYRRFFINFLRFAYSYKTTLFYHSLDDEKQRSAIDKSIGIISIILKQSFALESSNFITNYFGISNVYDITEINTQPESEDAILLLFLECLQFETFPTKIDRDSFSIIFTTFFGKLFKFEVDPEITEEYASRSISNLCSLTTKNKQLIELKYVLTNASFYSALTLIKTILENKKYIVKFNVDVFNNDDKLNKVNETLQIIIDNANNLKKTLEVLKSDDKNINGFVTSSNELIVLLNTLYSDYSNEKNKTGSTYNALGLQINKLFEHIKTFRGIIDTFIKTKLKDYNDVRDKMFKFKFDDKTQSKGFTKTEENGEVSSYSFKINRQQFDTYNKNTLNSGKTIHNSIDAFINAFYKAFDSSPTSNETILIFIVTLALEGGVYEEDDVINYLLNKINNSPAKGGKRRSIKHRKAFTKKPRLVHRKSKKNQKVHKTRSKRSIA